MEKGEVIQQCEWWNVWNG